MNYRKIYDALILRANSRKISGYTEKHHVIPRCMGGSDDPTNIVSLTPEEHFTAHVLLVKIYPEVPGLILAVGKMCQGNRRKSNKMYGWLKRKFSEEMSNFQSGRGNSQHGTMWITRATGETKKIKSTASIEDGWYRGRFGKAYKERTKRDRPIVTLIHHCHLCGSTIEVPTIYKRLCSACFSAKQMKNSHKQKGYKAQV